MNYKIIPITGQHTDSFRQAVGSVAREKKFLAFLDTPTKKMSQEFV